MIIIRIPAFRNDDHSLYSREGLLYASAPNYAYQYRYYCQYKQDMDQPAGRVTQKTNEPCDHKDDGDDVQDTSHNYICLV